MRCGVDMEPWALECHVLGFEREFFFFLTNSHY